VTPPLAHVAGVPVEETVLALLPAACALALAARATVGQITVRFRRRHNSKAGRHP
jgi:hypothetical protein